MSNVTNCDTSTLPSLGGIVPDDINAVAVARTNRTIPAMRHCCGDNEVHQAGSNNCVLWCEMPDDLMEEVSDSNAITDVMMDCLKRHDENVTGDGPFLTLGQDNFAAPMGRPSLVGLGLLALMVTRAVEWLA